MANPLDWPISPSRGLGIIKDGIEHPAAVKEIIEGVGKAAKDLLKKTERDAPADFKNMSKELAAAKDEMQSAMKDLKNGAARRDAIDPALRKQLEDRYRAVAEKAEQKGEKAGAKAADWLNRDRVDFISGKTDIPPLNTKLNPKYKGNE